MQVSWRKRGKMLACLQLLFWRVEEGKKYVYAYTTENYCLLATIGIHLCLFLSSYHFLLPLSLSLFLFSSFPLSLFFLLPRLQQDQTRSWLKSWSSGLLHYQCKANSKYVSCKLILDWYSANDLANCCAYFV